VSGADLASHARGVLSTEEIAMNDMTWIVVADASRARLLRRGRVAGRWDEVRELAHPESRMGSRDLTSDRDGRIGKGDRRRAGMPPTVSAHDREEERFAREVVEELEREHAAGSFERLVLVAAPRFLGLLRAELGDREARWVVGSHALDLTRLGTSAMDERLGELVG
jgi:protein required for attachment to host cells